jgi:heme oxygenase (mycobilin-producing)
MSRRLLWIVLGFLGGCASTKTTVTDARSPAMNALQTIAENDPNQCFRVDSFFVPDAARAEFEAQMQRNQALIETMPGFRGHLVFEKTGGPTTFNVVTIAIWESREALERAGVEVRAHYQKVGFDMSATLARWGVKAELGNFRARLEVR